MLAVLTKTIIYTLPGSVLKSVGCCLPRGIWHTHSSLASQWKVLG